MSPHEALCRYIPSLSFLSYLAPDKLSRSLSSAAQSLISSTASAPVSTYTSYVLKEVRTTASTCHFQYTLQSSSVFSSTGNSVTASQASGGVVESTVLLSTSPLLHTQKQVLGNLLMDHAIGQHTCLLGPKVSSSAELFLSRITSLFIYRGVVNLLLPESLPECLAIHHCASSRFTMN
jgi:hypothetical protein